jgi:cbb3-type cytochrome oxidase subunit 3
VASSFTLVVGLALLGVTAARVAAAIGLSSPTTFLMGAFVVAHAEVLLVALGLSLVRGFTAGWLLLTLGVVSLATVWFTRRARSQIDWRVARDVLRGDAVLIVLAVVAGLGFAYGIATGIWLPQVDDDVLTYHLVRAPLWWQHHGITYLVGTLDLRNNAYPPGGELGPLAAMTLAGNDYFVAVDQMLAALALAVGAVGISRRIGFGLRQSLFGGLLVLTLPIIALQAGTALSDLVVAAFLLAAALFLVDGSRRSPWLACAATGLAMDVKLTAFFGIPLLLVIAWLPRPERRRMRLVAVVAGTVLGAFWYAVNIKETGTWDGHVSEGYRVDRGPVAVTALIVRLAIEFIDLSGANGRDRWLYAVSAALIVAIALGLFLKRRHRRVLALGAVAAVIALVPIALLPIEHQIIRAYFKFWDAVGRRDLASIDSGRDITRSADNYSWFGPLGSVLLVAAGVLAIRAVRLRQLDRLAALCVLAPAYWLVAYSVLVFYHDWIGRYFAFPVVLAAATWGIVLRWRSVAWGVVAIAGTTVFLALANDEKRPSGLPLLERDKPRSAWTTPRWTGVALRDDYDAPIRFLDTVVPDSADVGLAITTSDPVYPFFGRGLDRQVRFVHEGDLDAASGVDWVFVRPGNRVSLRARNWKTVVVTRDGWRILRRTAAPSR